MRTNSQIILYFSYTHSHRIIFKIDPNFHPFLFSSMKHRPSQDILTFDACSTPAPINRKASFRLQSCNSELQDNNYDIGSSKKKVYFSKVAEKINLEETQFQQSSTLSNKTNYYDISSPSKSEIIKNLSELKGLLNLQIGSYYLRRIFKASQHNFDVKKFHQFCDDFEKTVVVAEIQNGNIVGGFTPLCWNDEYEKNKTHYKTDKLNKSFLFNFTCRQKYPLIKQTNNKAIIGCQYLGPTFGGGYDFSIGNFANKKYSSSCDFSTSYAKQEEVRNLKLTRRSLIGISQQLFLVKQWQVFVVCPKDRTLFENTFNNTINFEERNIFEMQSKSLADKKGFWDNFLGFFVNKNVSS